jgi:chromosomal replication initiation ATPase DnaA
MELTANATKPLLGWAGGQRIAVATSTALELPHPLLFGRGKRPRQPTLMEGRRIAAYLCREVAGLSFPETAQALNYGDHTSVMSLYQQAKAKLDDERFLAQLERVMEWLNDNAEVMWGR